MINYLLDPFIQIENNNGQPVVGAKIYVYYTGSRTVAPIYSDKEGTSLANPAITDTLGNVTIFAETGTFYDVLVYDSEDTLLFSKLNVTPSDSTAADVHEVDIEAGFGIQVHKHYLGNRAIYNVAIDPDEAATQADVSGKQDKLTAGANIEITPNNTINVVQRKEFLVQSPLKVDRSNNYLKLYLDTTFTENYKEKQNEVIIGGANTNYISKITQTENGNVSADVSNFVAGANINIAKANGNLTISGKDWTSEINNKIDKVTSGAGSETNPVYLSDSNVVTPCFSGSVKLANTTPDYFSADAGGNIMIYTPQGSHKDGDSIKNSIFITNYDNFLTPSTTDVFEDCIYMGYPYMYSPSNAGTCHYRQNILVGNNSISNAKDESNNNTIIGSQNDLIGYRGASAHKFNSTTLVGYQNNAYTDSYATTIVGCNNDVGNPYDDTQINNKEVQVSVFGYNNKFQYDTTNNGTTPTYGLMVGTSNETFAKDNYKTCNIGFENKLSGNCTYLIGDSLSATNEGSYEDKVMKVGFGSCHLEIHSTGIIYKVVNGTKTQI